MKTLFRLLRRLVVLVCIAAVLLTALPPLAREADRWVKVSWVNSKLPNYKTALELSAKDRDGLTIDLAMALSAAKVKVTALSARSMSDGHAAVNIVVEVQDKAELSAVINKLNNIQGVYHVARSTGK